MPRPKGMSKTTFYGIVMIANATLFTFFFAKKMIDQTTWFGGITLGTTIAGAAVAYWSEDRQTRKRKTTNDSQTQNDEDKN